MPPRHAEPLQPLRYLVNRRPVHGALFVLSGPAGRAILADRTPREPCPTYTEVWGVPPFG
jgi:hypothetical protein